MELRGKLSLRTSNVGTAPKRVGRYAGGDRDGRNRDRGRVSEFALERSRRLCQQNRQCVDRLRRLLLERGDLCARALNVGEGLLHFEVGPKAGLLPQPRELQR